MLEQLLKDYEEIQALNLQLNMARGKPSPKQLDISMPLLDVVTSEEALVADDGFDIRNYGIGTGLHEARVLMGSMLHADPEHIIVGGNSSLNLMYDTIARYWAFGALGEKPWSELETVKWICPVPGYDRHFAITEAFGIEMIPVDLGPSGPDMQAVEDLVQDETVKGIWCVPQYSNPSGVTYSNETVDRLASMKCAAQDFRIIWDNAYCVHDLYDETQERVADIADACNKAGCENRYLKFASTSKITFPGAGISALAASTENIAEISKHMNVQTIGHDKINQLRHVRFLKDSQGIANHMNKHADIIRPKFELVLEKLAPLADVGCTWSKPLGGYFICFAGLNGTAKHTVELAKNAGVVLTQAGAPFPYGIDPCDSIIRLAPTLPSLEELDQAMDVFVLCVKIACEQAKIS